MARITTVLKPSSDNSANLNAINAVFRQINQENRFEVVGQGVTTFPTVSVTIAGAGWYSNFGSTVVAHNLGFVPIVFAYILPSSGTNRIPLNFSQSGAFNGPNSMYTWEITALIDDTNVSFNANATAYYNAATTISFSGGDVKYLLVRETAATS